MSKSRAIILASALVLMAVPAKASTFTASGFETSGGTSTFSSTAGFQAALPGYILNIPVAGIFNGPVGVNLPDVGSASIGNFLGVAPFLRLKAKVVTPGGGNPLPAMAVVVIDSLGFPHIARGITSQKPIASNLGYSTVNLDLADWVPTISPGTPVLLATIFYAGPNLSATNTITVSNLKINGPASKPFSYLVIPDTEPVIEVPVP